ISEMLRPQDDTMRRLRQRIWSFVRDPDAGLPPASLVADSGWHPLLVPRTRALIVALVSEFGMVSADNLGQRLATTRLGRHPLLKAPTLTAVGASFRTSTVHRVKGESLDAVLYVAKKPHIRALLDGTSSEEGRIGYVALTRARDLFVLAVPDNCLKDFEPE